MLKTISLLQRGSVQRMSDELLKWLFGVNEVLKMPIATEHCDVPAQGFQQHVLKCMCWFRPFHVYFFGTVNKMQKSGCLLYPSFINLHFPLFLSNISLPSVTVSSSFYSSRCLFSVFFLTSPVLFQQDPQNFLLLQHIQ